MRPRSRHVPATVLLVAACAAAAVAGCASHSATSHTGPGAAAHTAPGKAAAPRARAVAEAAAVLRAFAVPPGARRLARAPHALKVPITSLIATTRADRVAFWQAPGQPQALLAWEQAHLPRRFTPGDQDFGPPSWDRMFSLRPVPGVLNTRELVVEVTGLGHGQTGIRVDAQVSWQPRRPASERVSATTRVVTITQLPGLDPHATHRPAPVTITRRPIVRRLAALVNSLQLSTIGPGALCPSLPGGGIRLTFRARPGGPPTAVAQGPAACGTVQFSTGGKHQPALQLTASFIHRILKLAGLRWKIQ